MGHQELGVAAPLKVEGGLRLPYSLSLESKSLLDFVTHDEGEGAKSGGNKEEGKG